MCCFFRYNIWLAWTCFCCITLSRRAISLDEYCEYTGDINDFIHHLAYGGHPYAEYYIDSNVGRVHFEYYDFNRYDYFKINKL